MRKFVFSGSYASAVHLLLDTYPAAAAYSLRKLRTAYTGAAIRVRRSSDNTETDIGFVGNDLDTASLLSFVGAGNGFVTTWYDQQGSFNVTQSTLANQPRIVNAGTLESKGGLPAVKFDGSNDFLSNHAAAFLDVVSTSYFSVSSNNVTGVISCIHIQYSVNNNSIRTFCDTRTTGGGYRNLIVANNLSTNYFADLSALNGSTNQRLLSSFIDASKNMSAFDNGNTGGTATYTGTTGNNGLRLGSQIAASFLNGYIQEFIAFNTDESANRTAIESNINTYYAIY
jgi:hypothetical protein